MKRLAIAFVAAALVAVSVSFLSLPAAHSAGAFNKGAGFAKQTFKENRQKEKQKAGKGKKKQG